MKHVQFTAHKEFLIEILKAQPGLLGTTGYGDKAGQKIAETAWAFINEFHRQFEEKVKG
ncbi:hypothetical protein L541_4897 [Bordetella hinzii CA90 BAL1384]|uniref:hypothetical protein n=1 Tax=Bordetella hinzii TaxID=103855 RepID=UPI00045A10A2|nr:hypothetical protein [Bordetella hinzii]KCB33749.1 hypothetical protein L541_4897 [Bordetella hinzii CA90 BAL1384]